jgi:hypothetical protein
VYSILIYCTVIYAEVFGVVGEAESGLFDSFGREIVEGSGVGN